jgi:hypothetical protein
MVAIANDLGAFEIPTAKRCCFGSTWLGDGCSDTIIRVSKHLSQDREIRSALLL